MSNEINYKNLIAFHPGSYVEDIIDDLNITQKEFARRLGTTEKSLSKLVNGEDNLSKEMAYKLSKLTGISINTWMNLQNEYEKKILDKKSVYEEITRGGGVKMAKSTISPEVVKIIRKSVDEARGGYVDKYKEMGGGLAE